MNRRAAYLSGLALAPVPITERAEAVNALLDSRASLAAVRDSTLPGTALYVAVERAIFHLDAALVELRP